MERCIADAAERAFKTERHGDVAVEFLRAGGPVFFEAAVAVVEGELPAAIEVYPLLALELRLRIFRARNILGADERERGGTGCRFVRGGAGGFACRMSRSGQAPAPPGYSYFTQIGELQAICPSFCSTRT